MGSAARSLVLTALVLIGGLAVGAAGATASTVDDPSGSTEPLVTTAPTSPEPSTPDSSPGDSTSETSSPINTLIAAGTPDSNIDTTTTTIAVVGFILLVALASWWMVRRNDPDSKPMPRAGGQSTPPSDLI
jgi:hypothetical protein